MCAWKQISEIWFQDYNWKQIQTIKDYRNIHSLHILLDNEIMRSLLYQSFANIWSVCSDIYLSSSWLLVWHHHFSIVQNTQVSALNSSLRGYIWVQFFIVEQLYCYGEMHIDYCISHKQLLFTCIISEINVITASSSSPAGKDFYLISGSPHTERHCHLFQWTSCIHKVSDMELQKK